MQTSRVSQHDAAFRDVCANFRGHLFQRDPEFVNKGEGELVVTGYVAKNESRFAGLAEKRAKAVATLLTEKYGVSADKITVEWKEAGEAPYSADQQGWNRVVIIRSK